MPSLKAIYTSGLYAYVHDVRGRHGFSHYFITSCENAQITTARSVEPELE